MQPIRREDVDAALARFVGGTTYLHLETTAGAYTEGGFGAFVRNAEVRIRRAQVRGADNRWRAGLETDTGWVYAEGLTHWEDLADGGLLLAGYDGEGRVTAVCELSRRPFPASAAPASIRPAAPAALRAGAAALAVSEAGSGDGARSGLAEATAADAPAVRPPTEERAVLVVLAHPDDETFGCGGTIALYTRAGVPVTLACATRGEMGRQMGNPPFATRENLRDLRVGELSAACAALGIQVVRLLGCWDKTTEFMRPDEVADRVAAMLAEVGPSLVITHHPEHGGHPDHCAVGAATVAAVRRLPADERPRVHCLVSWRAAEKLGIPLQTVDVSAVLDAKMAATRAHRSQSEAMLKRLTPEEAEKRREQIRRERYMVYPV